MKRAWAALLLAAPGAAPGDRISEMPRTELCVYQAKLSVAGYHYFRQGRARSAVIIHWHGDETPNEIDFVTRTLDEAYTRAESLQQADPTKLVSEQDFGDRTYDACMLGKAR